MLASSLYASINNINNIYYLNKPNTILYQYLSKLSIFSFTFYIYTIAIIMHLSIAMLFTLMATIQLATTAPAPVPVPQWDSKGVEAG